MKCRYCGESFEIRGQLLSHEWKKHELQLYKWKPKLDITE